VIFGFEILATMDPEHRKKMYPISDHASILAGSRRTMAATVTVFAAQSEPTVGGLQQWEPGRSWWLFAWCGNRGERRPAIATTCGN
jgi:hypothetical protein